MRPLQLLALLGLLAACHSSTSNNAYTTWEAYGGSKQSLHYSGLKQVDTGNVSRLRVAWTFHTGDADTERFSQIQCNPIIIDSVMYVTSPTLRLFALHAGTGQKIWEFDPAQLNSEAAHFSMNNNRGVTYWTDGNNDKRIFFVSGSYLNCIDATTGRLITGFGNQGRLDLHNDLGRDVKDLFVIATTPGIIYKDLYIIGSRVDEGPASAPGHVRAYDVRTGKLQWIFHTIPQPGEYGYDTWEDPIAWQHIGGANCWGGFSLDEKNNILFVPTGSAAFDFYGGKRKGQGLFANCLLALDPATGKRIWHFQFVHHDVWDYDLPSPPALLTIRKDGQLIDVVAQTSKQGMVWLFERKTGKPVFPINETPVDTLTTLAGEKLWPTQPIPSLPRPYVRQSFTETDLNPYLPDSSLAKLKKELAGYNYGHMFIPPSKKTTVELPGLDGGTDWGGPSVDPETGILYANANETGWLITIRDNKYELPASNETYGQAGRRLYQQYCISCHGADRKGSGNYPSLAGVHTKYTGSQALDLLNNGRRMMPSFRYVSGEEKNAILSYVLDDQAGQRKKFIAQQQPEDTFRNIPYGMTGYYKFMSEGYPAIGPPWGTLTAINLNTGEHVWKTTLGEYPELKARGVPPTGTENYGSSVVTAGGLVFIAAASDCKIRAFNKWNGNLLWEYELPAAGFATPAVYAVDGKQYIVIACGGGKLRKKSGDAFVAFALP